MADTEETQGVNDVEGANVAPEEDTYTITPEEQAAIDAIKRRNLIFAAIFGIILLVLGFLAGQYLRDKKKDDSLPDFSISTSVCEISAQGMVCL